MKVVDIVDNNIITGVRYGTIDVPAPEIPHIVDIVDNNIITGVRYGTIDVHAQKIPRDAARAYARVQRVQAMRSKKIRNEHTKQK